MSIRARLTLALLLGLLLGVVAVGRRHGCSPSAIPARAHLRPPAAASSARCPGGCAPAGRSDAARARELCRCRRRSQADAERHSRHGRGAGRSFDLPEPDEFEDMKVSTSGAYAGIGVEVAPGKDGVSVVRRMAELAGRARRHPGRRHDRQDRRPEVDPANLDAAIARMRGPEGSPIHLLVRRARQQRAARFQGRARAGASCRASPPRLLTPDYGYLRITSFTDTTAERARARGGAARAPQPAQAQGLHHRSAQQSRRGARCGGADRGRFPRSRHHRQRRRACARGASSAWRPSRATSAAAPRWCCWSTAARPRPRRSSPPRCTTISAPP